MKTPAEYIDEFIANDDVLKNLHAALIQCEQDQVTRRGGITEEIKKLKVKRTELVREGARIRTKIKFANAAIDTLAIKQRKKTMEHHRISMRIRGRTKWLTYRANDKRAADAAAASSQEFWDHHTETKMVNPPEAAAT